MFKLMDKKIIAILCNFFVLNWPYESIRCQNNLFSFNNCELQNKSVILVLSLFCYFFSMICWFYTVLLRVRDPRGGTLIFSHIGRLGPFFFGSKF